MTGVQIVVIPGRGVIPCCQYNRGGRCYDRTVYGPEGAICSVMTVLGCATNRRYLPEGLTSFLIDLIGKKEKGQ